MRTLEQIQSAKEVELELQKKLRDKVEALKLELHNAALDLEKSQNRTVQLWKESSKVEGRADPAWKLRDS